MINCGIVTHVLACVSNHSEKWGTVHYYLQIQIQYFPFINRGRPPLWGGTYIILSRSHHWQSFCQKLRNCNFIVRKLSYIVKPTYTKDVAHFWLTSLNISVVILYFFHFLWLIYITLWLWLLCDFHMRCPKIQMNVISLSTNFG